MILINHARKFVSLKTNQNKKPSHYFSLPHYFVLNKTRLIVLKGRRINVVR